MTFTTDLRAQKPILALNKSKEHVTLSPVSEGDKTLTFDNSGDTIAVGEFVFISTSADADNQFVGKCLTSAAGAITVEYGAQEATGASSKLWVPTSALYFQYGEARASGIVRQVDTGTNLIVSRGGVAYPQQTRDAVERILMSIAIAAPSDWENYLVFVQTTLTAGTSAVSFAFWDTAKEETRCVQAQLDVAPMSYVSNVHDAFSFGVPVVVQAEDTYYEA